MGSHICGGRSLLGGIASCLFALSAAGQDADQAGDRTPIRPDAFERQIDGLSGPSAVAIAPDGTILVLEADGHRISAFAGPARD